LRSVFLGTGTSTGIPLIGCNCAVCTSDDPRDKRLRTSIYFESPDTRIVVDTGPDFRAQMLANRLSDLDAVLFTHNHKDHTGGLDDIRPINFLRKKTIDVYAELYVQEALRREYAYIFHEKDYPGIPRIEMKTIDETPFRVGNIEVMPVRVWHMNLPVFGYRIQDFTYITDANKIERSELDKIRGSKILVLNALRHESHYSHFTLSEAMEIVREVRPEQAYFTHISHQMGLYAEVQASLPENVFLAYDGLELQF